MCPPSPSACLESRGKGPPAVPRRSRRSGSVWPCALAVLKSIGWSHFLSVHAAGARRTIDAPLQARVGWRSQIEHQVVAWPSSSRSARFRRRAAPRDRGCSRARRRSASSRRCGRRRCGRTSGRARRRPRRARAGCRSRCSTGSTRLLRANSIVGPSPGGPAGGCGVRAGVAAMPGVKPGSGPNSSVWMREASRPIAARPALIFVHERRRAAQVCLARLAAARVRRAPPRSRRPAAS